MAHILIRLLIPVFALLLMARFLPGVEVSGFYAALIVSILLGIINITLKPILFVLTLPITIITFGLFSFILNGLLLWLVALFVEGFTISGFLWAVLAAFIISLFSWVGNKMLSD